MDHVVVDPLATLGLDRPSNARRLRHIRFEIVKDALGLDVSLELVDVDNAGSDAAIPPLACEDFGKSDRRAANGLASSRKRIDALRRRFFVDRCECRYVRNCALDRAR